MEEEEEEEGSWEVEEREEVGRGIIKRTDTERKDGRERRIKGNRRRRK